MEQDVYLYRKSHPKQSLIDEIFAYDVNTLEQTDDVVISKYVIGLSQYLIYFKSQLNEVKLLEYQKSRLLEASIAQLITDDVVKKYKTKKDARAHLVYNDEILNKLQIDIDTAHDEAFVLEGMDKVISELIAAFKRELTRRENELYQKRNSR
jgi:5-formaminoimidazole-4-carboxamide-1-beta-D-ribofuranosyl 5'-monophosphate synthetase